MRITLACGHVAEYARQIMPAAADMVRATRCLECERKAMGKSDNRKITVYPGDRITDILGSSSPRLNRALGIAATVLGDAQDEVESLFAPAEWRILRSRLDAFFIDPEYRKPQLMVAEKLERCSEASPDLIVKIKDLTYPQFWAMLLVIEWAEDHEDSADRERSRWWLRAFRAAVRSRETAEA